MNNVNPTRRVILLALIVTSVFLSACHRAKTSATKRYPFTGRIVSMDNQTSTAVIAGDNIPGFMDPMTMSYKIKEPEPQLATKMALSPGTSIAAEVVVTETDPKNEDAVPDYWLENVRIIARAPAPPAAAPSALHIPSPGEESPTSNSPTSTAIAFRSSSIAARSCSSRLFTPAVPSPISARA